MAAVNSTNGAANPKGMSFTPDAGFDPKANKFVTIGAPRSSVPRAFAEGVVIRGSQTQLAKTNQAITPAALRRTHHKKIPFAPH
jgi:hypothetical protein